MKNTKMLTLGGKLRKDYRKLYAKYLVKYIKAYSKMGINIEYVTVQNEPLAVQTWESCIYSPEEEIDFAVNFLYPEFQKNEIQTKIFIWDQNKEKLLNRARAELSNERNKKMISGIAFHWYTGDHFENIALCREMFPNLLLFHTEGCTGFSNFNEEDEVKNAQIYAHDIMGDLNAGVNAYIDWNLMLDHKGGPNHKKNFCNSPIMLNEDSTNYIKNLTYYYIAHFSKYIRPGAKRLAFSRYTTDIEVTALKNINNSIIVVLLNRNNFNKEYNLVIENQVLHDNLDSNAIVTYKIDMW